MQKAVENKTECGVFFHHDFIFYGWLLDASFHLVLSELQCDYI